jgi:hypothetical protein
MYINDLNISSIKSLNDFKSLMRMKNTKSYHELCLQNNSFDLRSIMDKAENLFIDEIHQDIYVGDYLKKHLASFQKVSDGICMCAAFTVCMGFLGYGLRKYEKFPSHDSACFKDFGDYAYKQFGMRAANGDFDIPNLKFETIRNCRKRLASLIKERTSDGFPVMVSIDNSTHWIAALNYKGRIWFIDALQGCGFNLYSNFPIKWNSYIGDCNYGPVFLPPVYYAQESKSNWWIANNVDNCNPTIRALNRHLNF